MAETMSALRELTAEAAQLQRAASGSVTSRVFEWLIPQYAVAAREQVKNAPTPVDRWKVFRQMTSDLAPVRRGELDAGWLALDRERLAFDRARTKANTDKTFWKWTKRAAIRKKLFPRKKGGISPATFRKIERELNLL
jgi:hypothetical protein